MLQDEFQREVCNLLELDEGNDVDKMIIGEDIDSLELLNLISFVEERFSILLEPDDILGKSLKHVYDLIRS